MAWTCLAAAPIRRGDVSEAAPRGGRRELLCFAMMQPRFLTGEPLPALHDYVAIQRVDFHEVSPTSRLLGADQRGAAAPEEIKHPLSCPRGVPQRSHRQLNGLFSQVDHALRAYLSHRPDVPYIGWPVKFVSSTLPPAVKTPFVITHVVLPRQHGVLLDPNDGLREIQAGRLEHRWIVATIGVASPNV